MGRQSARSSRRVDRDLQAIGALTQAVLDGDDLEQLLGRIAREARVLVDAVSGVVVTVSDAGEMTFRGVDGLSVGPLKVGHVMPVRDTLTELALIEGDEHRRPRCRRDPAGGARLRGGDRDGSADRLAPGPDRKRARRAWSSLGRRIRRHSGRPTSASSRRSRRRPRARSSCSSSDPPEQGSRSAPSASGSRASSTTESSVRSATCRPASAVSPTGRTTRGWRPASPRPSRSSMRAIETIGGYVVELRESAPHADAGRGEPCPGNDRILTSDIRRAAAPPTTGRASDRTIAVIGELARTAAADAPTDEILQALVRRGRGTRRRPLRAASERSPTTAPGSS